MGGSADHRQLSSESGQQHFYRNSKKPCRGLCRSKRAIALSAKFAADMKSDTKTVTALFQLGAGKTQQVIIPVNTRLRIGNGEK